jgi:Carboxypeptidase regulatory-like domain/TonB dependent receptor
MPRNPDEYTCVVCPPSKVSQIETDLHRRVPLSLRFIPAALHLLLLLTFCQSFVSNASGQSATATLSGTVTDQAGAVVPGVNIAVISVAQGFERGATTNSEGIFVVPLLPPGNYVIKAEHEGFTPAELTNVVLNVNDRITISIQLKVGTLQGQTVNVIDSPTLIDESPGNATVVDRQFVGNLPLNGRSFQQLLTLSPGAIITRSTLGEQGQVSANIGVSINDDPYQSASGSLPGLSASGGTNNLVSVDALQEFKIQTSTYAAEFGRTPGAQVQIITRSGSNEFHGSVFNYFRNEVLDANDWFNNARRLPKPATRQNDFGFVLGGPFLLPRFGEGGRQPGYNGRNRTFFFASYEGLRLRLPQSRTTDVPSLAAREAASPAIQPILRAYPRPNGPDRIGSNGLPNGIAVFNASFSNPSTLDATSVRIDHTLNNKFALFGRVNYSPSSIIERGQSGTYSLNTLNTYRVTTETVTIGATGSFTPTINNELRANFSRNTGEGFFEIDNFGGAVPPPETIFFPPGFSPLTSRSSFNLAGLANPALNLGTLARNLQRQFNIVDSMVVASSAHEFKFGVDYRRLFPVISPQSYFSFIQFAGVGTPGAATQPPNSALSGRALTMQISSSAGKRFPIFNNLSLFAQDNWKATQRLTLTYGLRWELNTPPTEGSGNDPVTVLGLENPATATIAPRGTPLWETTYNNFAPRIGLAYRLIQQPGSETMLRGGFGIFYDLGSGSISNAFGNAYPYTAIKSFPGGTAFPLAPADRLPPTNPTRTPFYVFEPNIQLPRTYQWTFTVEQAFGSNQSLSASYVAALGRKLLREDTLFGTTFGGTLNPSVFPGTAQVIVTRNTATSDYHAMQVQFQRRLSQGLQTLVSYTWAHSIDIASNDSFNINTPANKIDPFTDRGPSNFDVRHSFSGATSYNIPSINAGQVGNAILSGWSVDGIFIARSAAPFNITFTKLIPGLGAVAVRPDFVPGIPIYVDDPTAPGGRRVNNTRVTIPGNPLPQIGPFLRQVPGRQGTLGRNALRGFPVYQLDLALRRQFNLTEKVYLQFRSEFFNILNHPNFGLGDGATDAALSSSNFGISQAMLGRFLGSGGTGGGFNPLYQIGGPRSIQFSLKLGF